MRRYLRAVNVLGLFEVFVVVETFRLAKLQASSYAAYGANSHRPGHTVYVGVCGCVGVSAQGEARDKNRGQQPQCYVTQSLIMFWGTLS